MILTTLFNYHYPNLFKLTNTEERDLTTNQSLYINLVEHHSLTMETFHLFEKFYMLTLKPVDNGDKIDEENQHIVDFLNKQEPILHTKDNLESILNKIEAKINDTSELNKEIRLKLNSLSSKKDNYPYKQIDIMTNSDTGLLVYFRMGFVGNKTILMLYKNEKYKRSGMIKSINLLQMTLKNKN